MKILLTIKEYAKFKGLSQQAISKQVVSKLCESCIIDKITYIIYEDDRLDKAKQTIKNKNSQIRELKLKLSIQNDSNKYLQEIEKQNKKLEKRNQKLEKKVDKIQAKKDKLYENILGTLVNQNKQIQG